MNQINSIILEGNLTKNPELKELQNGLKVCELSLACNRYVKNNNNEYTKDVDFFRCECWNSLAEYLCSQGHKGQHIRIVGRLKQNRWKDSSGKEMSNIVIVGEHIVVLKTEPEKQDIYNTNKEIQHNDESFTFDIPF